VDFGFVSYMQLDDVTPEDWHNVRGFAELADAIHEEALKTYPESDYAKRHGFASRREKSCRCWM